MENNLQNPGAGVPPQSGGQQNIPAPTPQGAPTAAQQSPPAKPVAPSAPASPAPAVPAATQSGSTPSAQSPTGATATPAQAAATPGQKVIDPAKQAAKRKKTLFGCFGAFGCSFLIFIVIIVVFLASGSSDNPLFEVLGLSQGEVVNVLITLVHLTFLLLVFIAFIVATIGIFKVVTAKKDDKAGKRSGLMLAFISFIVMIILIITWMSLYFFLDSKRSDQVRRGIVTEPEITIQLTAPITVKFDATRAPINVGQYEILAYKWDFGDKTELLGPIQSHTYTELGSYTVTLTVSVKDRVKGEASEVTFTKDVTIKNVKATVTIVADPEEGPVPLTIAFDGSESKSPNGDITAYAWDFDEDGQFDDAESATAEYEYAKVGQYLVKLRVTDSTGDFAVGEKTITVTEPNDPIPVITLKDVAEGADLEAGIAYLFSAENSTSPLGKIEQYTWDFGDGTTGKIRTISHAFEKPGTYVVSLSVSDSVENRAAVETTVTVKNQETTPRPVITTVPPVKDDKVMGEAPFTVVFDASKSTDANDDIVEYQWDFNADGKTDKAQEKTAYTFVKPGTYTVQLTLTDATEKTATADVVIEVVTKGVVADLRATPISGVVPLTVAFDAAGSSYLEGEIVSYEWEFGDGGAPRADVASVKHQYSSIGNFTAKVIAIASDGTRDDAEIKITVRPVSVKACFESSTVKGKAPLEVGFDPTCSTGTIVKYRWNFGDKKTSIDRKPLHTFTTAGAYDVILEVSDSQNVIDTFSQKITVE